MQDRPIHASDVTLTAVPGVWVLSDFADTAVVHGFGDRTLTAETLAERLGYAASSLVRLEQVHGAVVAEVDAAYQPGVPPWPGADGAVTDRAGVALTVRTADCAPVGFYDPAHRAIGIAHVGWRGLEARLLLRMVEVMARRWGAQPAQLRVALGPMIGPCCYEVGPEFEPRFPAWVRQERGRRVLDVRQGIMAQLREAGVDPVRVADSQVCTGCHADRFHSYRRAGVAAGRCHFLLALVPDRAVQGASHA